jgi:hypothetical protein
MRQARRLLLWVSGAAAALLATAIVANLALTLALFGPGEGVARMTADWDRIWVARALGAGEINPQAAFERLYGPRLGARPSAQQIREHVRRDFERDEPGVFDVILASYVLERFGAIDGRTLPSGVYLAAGPIGPDPWPRPLITQYLVFPRHGYLLVVPPPEAGRYPAAYEATASLRRIFRRSGDADALYGVVQPYAPGAYDFPTAGEPVHDLILLTTDVSAVRRIKARLTSFSRELDAKGLPYRLLRRNSNSALACYLEITGISPELYGRLPGGPLMRMRLPGLSGEHHRACDPSSPPRRSVRAPDHQP